MSDTEMTVIDPNGKKIYVCDKPMTPYHGALFQASNATQIAESLLAKKYTAFVYLHGTDRGNFAWFELASKKIRFGCISPDIVKFCFKVTTLEEYTIAKDKAQKRKELFNSVEVKGDCLFTSGTRYKEI